MTSAASIQSRVLDPEPSRRFARLYRVGKVRRVRPHPAPGADVDSFALALYETQVLVPNKWFASLEDLKAALSAKGVPVEVAPKEI